MLAVLLALAIPGSELQQRGVSPRSLPCSVAQKGALGGFSTGRGRRGSTGPWIPKRLWRQEDEDYVSVSGAYRLMEIGCTGAMRLRGGGGKKAKERRKLLRSQGRILEGEAEGKVMKPKRREKEGMRESEREKGKERKEKRGRGMEMKREGGGKEADHVNVEVETSFALAGKTPAHPNKQKNQETAK